MSILQTVDAEPTLAEQLVGLQDVRDKEIISSAILSPSASYNAKGLALKDLSSVIGQLSCFR
jgi:hypothetical protein